MSNKKPQRYKPCVSMPDAFGLTVVHGKRGTAVKIKKINGKEYLIPDNGEAYTSEQYDKEINDAINELFDLVTIPAEYKISNVSDFYEFEPIKDFKDRANRIDIDKARLSHLDTGTDEYKTLSVSIAEREKPNKKRLRIDDVSHDDLIRFVDRDKLLLYVEKYGLPYDVRDNMDSIAMFDYSHFCEKVLFLYCFADFLESYQASDGAMNDESKCKYAQFIGVLFAIDRGKNPSQESCCSLLSFVFREKNSAKTLHIIARRFEMIFRADLEALTFQFDTSSIEVKIVSQDYFSFFTYKLLTMWGILHKGGKITDRIVRCEGTDCKAIFVASHGRVKYCNKCFAQTEYSRTDAAKEVRRQRIEKNKAAKLLKEKEGEPNGADN